MRTLVDLPENDIKALDLMGKRMGESRAELVRRAVADYLDKENKPQAIKHDLFGAMKDVFTEDALVYEQRVRSEWDEREENTAHWSLNEPDTSPYKKDKS